MVQLPSPKTITILSITTLLLLLLLLPLTTVVLTLLTLLRGYTHWNSTLETSIYSGRVSHTRYHPTRHSFSYPFFFMCLELKECQEILFAGSKRLWPLSWIIQFREADHLKNREGSLQEKSGNTLQERICRLMAQRTDGKYAPDPEHQRIVLLTHLSYFGYCFNPVSFYYALSPSGETEAVVAEVSNTPWNEMQCYVLHPDSVDVTQVKSSSKEVNYIFNKRFHVSPFMEMEHVYDWTFTQPIQKQIRVCTKMIHSKTNTAYFNAVFSIKRTTLSPTSIMYLLLKYPTYCLIMQIWIHIQALILFWKGVEFYPHPDGTETRASQVIGCIMAPFFWVKDRCSFRNTDKEKVQ